ncbi:DNA repair protein RAD51 homolog 4 isoform X2 [Scophthalmus maximus]|uniref:DNA repair protein RAD51 homolog 4 isoform X2 n=1 Tax=Scophthalmus maximus TaxID=52904 RepID=UPI0015E0AED9|nr:DNA repair protein RAD51 homolog 4 isoform X2 [Scophthalmus maximus]XP_035481429.1 DNA repair protein RAD51 homolog 4 isoform X2 [Scophthalmus maximus]
MLRVIQGSVRHPPSAAGSTRGFPGVGRRSLRGAVELHGHPLHRKSQHRWRKLSTSAPNFNEQQSDTGERHDLLDRSHNGSLDKLLDSGLYTGEITELSGGPGSGKSQVCFGVAVHISHQLKQNVIYVDTTGGLTAGRLLQMLQAETSNAEEQMEALQRIRVFRLFDVFSLLDCLYGLCGGGLQRASVGGGSVKAVIVDSVSAVIAPLLGGKQNEGMSLMSQVAGVLKTMAKDFNVAALVTNHVTRSGGGGGEVQPGLGASWSHIPRTRVLLEKGGDVRRPGLRSATLIKSSRRPLLIKEEFDLKWWSRSKEEGGGAAAAASGKRKRDETDS